MKSKKFWPRGGARGALLRSANGGGQAAKKLHGRRPSIPDLLFTESGGATLTILRFFSFVFP